MAIQCYEETHVSNTSGVKNGSVANYLRDLWKRFSEARAQIKQQKINRDAFKSIARLDEHMLKDIGLTKGDVIWASNLPLSANAAAELEIVARRKHK